MHLRLDTLCGFYKKKIHAKQRYIFWLLNSFLRSMQGKVTYVQVINITLTLAAHNGKIGNIDLTIVLSNKNCHVFPLAVIAIMTSVLLGWPNYIPRLVLRNFH